MKIKELKDYLASLPNDFDDYDVVISEEGQLDEEHTYRKDIPINKIFVDEDNYEMCILMQNE